MSDLAVADAVVLFATGFALTAFSFLGPAARLLPGAHFAPDWMVCGIRGLGAGLMLGVLAYVWRGTRRRP